jgi:hypothetical protein
LSSDQAKATQLQQQIEATGEQISALGQQYDRAVNQVGVLQGQITSTQTKIDADKKQVDADLATLRVAALNDFVTDGQALTENPLFAANQTRLAQQQEFSRVAEGDINVAVANLHTAQAVLSQQQATLVSQQQQAQTQANTARSAPGPAVQRQRWSGRGASGRKLPRRPLRVGWSQPIRGGLLGAGDAGLAGSRGFPPPLLRWTDGRQHPGPDLESRAR